MSELNEIRPTYRINPTVNQGNKKKNDKPKKKEEEVKKDTSNRHKGKVDEYI